MIEINKIYNEDCLVGMKRIPDKSVDMILCDLPYGTTACSWDIIIPFEKLWEQYNRIIKQNGAIVLFGSEPFSSYLRMSNIKNYKYDWIWHKNKGGNPMNAKINPMKQHENISIFGNGSGVVYIPIKEQRADSGLTRVKSSPIQGGRFKDDAVYGKTKHIKKKYDDLRFPQTVQKFNVERGLHPTQKPVALMEYLIKTYTNEGELVLDNCIGSGTTAVACIGTNRNFIGFEMNKKYFDIANKRLKQVQKVLF